DTKCGTNPQTASTKLLRHQRDFERAQSRSSELFRNGQVQQAQLKRLAVNVQGKDLIQISLGGNRNDLPIRKLARQVLNHFLFLCQREVHVASTSFWENPSLSSAEYGLPSYHLNR